MDYQKILEEQGKVCAISGMPPDESSRFKRLSVDHNHSTGMNRGLLHPDINLAIGLFQENTEWLRKAADYLDYWNSLESESLCQRVA